MSSLEHGEPAARPDPRAAAGAKAGSELRWDGPEAEDLDAGEPALVLAHGSGGGMEGEPLASIAAGLGALGVRVLRFEFPFVQAQRETGERHLPDEDEVLRARLIATLEGLPRTQRWVIGGYSLGGRIAAQVAASPGVEALGVVALVCVAYPFHPIGAPGRQAAMKVLAASRVPALVVQGTRDAFGNREQVRGYRLGSETALCWLEGAKHGLRTQAGTKPRADLRGEDPLQVGIRAIAEFVSGRSAVSARAARPEEADR